MKNKMALNEKMPKEERQKKKRIKKEMILVILSFFLFFSACGSKSESGNVFKPNEAQDAIAGFPQNGGAAEKPNEDPDAETKSGASNDKGNEQETGDVTILPEKLVYRCHLSMETLEYEDSMSKIRQLIMEQDGFIQSEEEYDSDQEWYTKSSGKKTGTRRSTMTVRIPTRNYDSFLNTIGNAGKITNRQTSVDNISRTYYNTKTDIESCRIQQERLLEMLKKCDNIADMITVEARLGEVQAELSKLTTEIRTMDSDVAYSYVTLSINEVVSYTKDPEKGFGEKLAETFVDSWVLFADFIKGFVLVFTAMLPFLILIAAITVLVVYCIRRSKKKAKPGNKAGVGPNGSPVQGSPEQANASPTKEEPDESETPKG